MTYSKYFKMPGNLNDDVNELTTNYIDDLINENSFFNDLKVLEVFLKLKREKNVSANSFLYAYSLADVKHDISINNFINNMSNILNINNFDISGNKMGINGFDNLNEYDYRITFSNSFKLTFSDIQLFFEKFNKKAKENNLPYGLKIEPNNSDLIIFYLKESNLGKTIKVIEELKQSDLDFCMLLNKFGNKKPFTATINNSNYGVSMGTSKIFSEKMKGFFAIGDTFTSYSAKLLDSAYAELHKINNGNVASITSIDLYQMMQLLHNKNYGYSANENIPLWMNGDNYVSYNSKKVDTYNKL